jgi:hypothetical protein
MISLKLEIVEEVLGFELWLARQGRRRRACNASCGIRGLVQHDVRIRQFLLPLLLLPLLSPFLLLFFLLDKWEFKVGCK